MRRGLVVVLALAGFAAVTGAVTAQMRRGWPAVDETPALEIQAQLVKPPLVPTAIDRTKPAKVVVALETTEENGRLANGVEYTFWTFGGTVPGPFLRVREGDTVQIRLANAKASRQMHSIDLHAVTGPGGGAAVTQVLPGEEGVFEWKALNPRLYVYHCATPHIPVHIANGMYGRGCRAASTT